MISPFFVHKIIRKHNIIQAFWEKVLTEVDWTLEHKYGIRILFDESEGESESDEEESAVMIPIEGTEDEEEEEISQTKTSTREDKENDARRDLAEEKERREESAYESDGEDSLIEELRLPETLAKRRESSSSDSKAGAQLQEDLQLFNYTCSITFSFLTLSN